MQDDRNQLFFDFYEDVSHSEEDKESSHPGVSNVIDKLNFDTEEEALEVLTGKKSIKDVIEDDTENWSSCDAGNPEDMAAKAWLENRDASVISPESSSNPIPGMEGNGSPFPDVSGVSSDLSDTANAVSLRDDHVSLDSAEPSVIPEKE